MRVFLTLNIVFLILIIIYLQDLLKKLSSKNKDLHGKYRTPANVDSQSSGNDDFIEYCFKVYLF